MNRRRSILLLVVAVLLAVDSWFLLQRAGAGEAEQPEVLLDMTRDSLIADNPEEFAQLTPDARGWVLSGQPVVRPPATRLNGSSWEGEPPGVGAAIGLGSDGTFGRAIAAVKLLASLDICGVAILDPDVRANGQQFEGLVFAIRQTPNESGRMEKCVPHPSYLAPDDPRLKRSA